MADLVDTPPAPETSGQRPLSLRLQVVLLLAFATLPVGVLAVAQGYAAFSDTEKLRHAALANDAFEQTVREQGAIREAFGALDALLTQISPDMPAARCSERLRDFVIADRRISFTGFTSEDGVMRCGYPLIAPLDLTQTPEYKHFTADPRRTVTVFQKGPISNLPVVTLSTPVWREGKLAGSIALSLPSIYIGWASAPERDTASRYALLDGKGQTVARPDQETEMTWLPQKSALQAMMRDTRRPLVGKSMQGESRIYSISPLFKRDIFAVSSWPEGRATGRLTMLQLITLLLPLIMWGLAVTVAYFAVDRFALRHVVYLDRLVSAYARSGRSLRASGMREAPLEFAALGESFDRMAQEIENREDALRQSIGEKDTLLKEVYHRVRNNLQMIVSLMNLQLRTTTGERERETLQRLQDRILGLAAVHKRLSEAGQVSAIRIDLLLREVVESARDSRDSGQSAIALKFDMIEHVEGPDRAIPLALFTAEVGANAFNHGLGRAGRRAVRLTLRETDAEEIELVISNARTVSCTTEPDTAGLGAQLIDSFAQQLRGRVEREITPDRYTIRLFFPRVSPQGSA